MDQQALLLNSLRREQTWRAADAVQAAVPPPTAAAAATPVAMPLAALAAVAPAASPMASAANSEAGRRAPGTHYSPSFSAGGVLSTPGQACVLAELDSLDAEIEGLHVSLHDAAVKFGVDVGAPGAASE